MRDPEYSDHITSIADWMTRYYQKNNPGKRRSKQNYEAIAERYLTACHRVVFRGFGKTLRSDNVVSIKDIRTMVPDRIEIQGKAEYWAYILRDKFPVWQIVKKGHPGGLSEVKILHNDLWRSIMNNNISERLWDDHEIIEHIRETYERLCVRLITDEPPVEEISVDITNLDNAITHYAKWYQEAYQENNTDRMDKVVRMMCQAKNLSQAVKALNTAGATKQACIPHFPEYKNYRKYYLGGLNLQNCLSEVRHAALGKCHSYDLRSSVYTFYADLCEDKGIANYHIKNYAQNTKQIRQSLANIIKPHVGKANAEKIIKNYITAMGFGATQTQGYTDANGDYQNSALSQILMSPKARADLAQSEIMQGLQSEISGILDYMRNNTSAETQHKWRVKHKKDRYAPRKHLCEMYTDWESRVMGEITQYVKHRHPEIKILIQIHDCMYVSHKLDTSSIHDVLRLESISMYARLEHTEHDSYHNVDQYERYQEQNTEHLERMGHEQALAMNYHSSMIDTETANKPRPVFDTFVTSADLSQGQQLAELCATNPEIMTDIESDPKLLANLQAYKREQANILLKNIEFSQEHGEFVS